MNLNYRSIRVNDNKSVAKPVFKALAPLVALIAFGCAKTYKDQSGITINGLTTAQIIEKHREILKTSYGIDIDPTMINVRTESTICVSFCNSSPEEGEVPFNYNDRAMVVDVSNGSRYHKYAYTAEGRRIWEGIGDDQRRYFVMCDANDFPILVKEARKMDYGWISFDLERDRAAQVWGAAVTEFLQNRTVITQGR